MHRTGNRTWCAIVVTAAVALGTGACTVTRTGEPLRPTSSPQPTTTPPRTLTATDRSFAMTLSGAIADGNATAFNAMVCPGSQNLALTAPLTPVPAATMIGLRLDTGPVDQLTITVSLDTPSPLSDYDYDWVDDDLSDDDGLDVVFVLEDRAGWCLTMTALCPLTQHGYDGSAPAEHDALCEGRPTEIR